MVKRLCILQKIRYKHHKDMLEDLLTLVKDDMDAHNDEHKNRGNNQDARSIRSSELPPFLRQDELALSLTKEDIESLAGSFEALRKDEEDLKDQILHSVKLERMERTRKGNIEARQQEIAARQQQIFESYCGELQNRKQEMAEKNKLQWLQVQRTFLGNWLNQDHQIKAKKKVKYWKGRNSKKYGRKRTWNKQKVSV